MTAQPLPTHSSEPASAINVLRALRAAVVFLTRVPAGGFPYREAEWRWSPAWFPLVGAGVGGVAGGVGWLTRGAGPFVAAALAVSASLLITGAFHEDGLADTADALGGAYDREKLFIILKDSRIGTFGGAALIMALVLRVALLAQLGSAAPLALVMSGALSRVPPVWLMAALPYVTPPDGARSRPVVRGGLPQALWATAVAAAIAVGLGIFTPAAALAAALVSMAVALLGGWRFHVRAGGLTGDFLGATQQVAECTLLLTLVLRR